jgi:two-component system, OmpR family, KDP operon response regulator KdpE
MRSAKRCCAETFLHGRKVTLTPKEYRLLRFLMIHRGTMLPHRQTLGELWGASQEGNSQYLRAYIGQLREKLEDIPSRLVIITTEPGVGYRMEHWKRM